MAGVSSCLALGPLQEDSLTAYDNLRALALNLNWTWDRAVRNIFERLDPALWEETGRNPIELMRRLGRETVERRLNEEGLTTVITRADRLPRRRGMGCRARRRGRLLLDGVRPHRLPADLLRRPGHPRRRPAQGRGPAGCTDDRRWIALRHRLRAATAQRGWRAGLLLPGDGPRLIADRAAGARRDPGTRDRADRVGAGDDPGLAGAGGPGAATASGHRPRGESAGPAQHHRAPIPGRPGATPEPGDRARHRRRPRASRRRL